MFDILHQFPVQEGTRVLIIAEDPQLLERIVEEARAAGIRARGMTAHDADGAIHGWFDIMAFGAAITAEKRTALEREALFHNPGARFLKIHAPFAVSQLLEAVNGGASPPVDLGAYFQRIGYSGPARPTLDVLAELVSCHVATIPFEAIDVLLDRGIDITPAAVDAKLIGRRRGGYCYEQNGLLARVLKAIGFEVESLSAHVTWMSEPGKPLSPLTHRVLRVTIDGQPWLADVGFGSAVPAQPLRLDLEEPQVTAHDTYRLVPNGQHMLLQARIDDQWKPVYSISSEPWLDGHYEMANWYSSKHADSHFRHRLIVTRSTQEARYILSEGRLTIRRPDGTTERHFLDADQILETFASIFGLDVEPEWRPVAERAAKAVESERLAEAA